MGELENLFDSVLVHLLFSDPILAFYSKLKPEKTCNYYVNLTYFIGFGNTFLSNKFMKLFWKEKTTHLRKNH